MYVQTIIFIIIMNILGNRRLVSMSRGYGKSYRKGFSHASFQFDKLFKENSNRPSAARSAGTVGKWGITSFTSIRSSNGTYISIIIPLLSMYCIIFIIIIMILCSAGLSTPQYPEVTPTNKRMKLDESDQNTKSKSKDPFSFEQGGLSDKNSSSNIQPVKPKKFFKSRNAKPSDEVQSDSAKCSDKVDFSYGASGGSPSKKPKASYGAKKFFQSKRSPSPSPASTTAAAAAATAAAAAAAAAAKREDNKPPIVLRISRGKSRLLSDSDESESTPTPSSAPSSSTVTSPRSTRDSQPTRITRSTRRSMQQDLSNSPTSAETPTETFASLLSPEYIAPEKFELERKAMYDNLLGPSSPVDSSISSTAHDTSTVLQEAAQHEPDSEPIFTTGSQELEGSSQEPEDIVVTKDSQESCVNEEFSQETESSGIFTQDTIGNTQDSQEIIPEPLDTSTLTDNSDKEKLNEAEELLKSTNVDFSSVTDDLSVPSLADTLKSTPSVDAVPSPPAEITSAAAAAAAVAADTSSESDSESSQPPPSNPPAADDPSASSANTIDQHRDEIMEKILEKPIVEAPTVKLVISKKKGSIFKSRSMVQDGSKKRHALYKHKWCDDKDLAAQVCLFV